MLLASSHEGLALVTALMHGHVFLGDAAFQNVCLYG